ncbi:MAG: YajQ family cyclic di-GMP-binding protein [Deferribacteraceae bacterium]|jgi:uncharacterized protein YajQ (UPF0234 family)|nr:YajQ family cyclic di-GMP-binding protein [Deferribacteraceae bacterium]
MPSFDAVNEIDMQEVDNAVNNVKKELTTRYDFKGSNTELELNKKDGVITITSTDEMKMDALREMLIVAMIKRGVDKRTLDFAEVEKAGGNKLRRTVTLKQGLDKDQAKKITALIKDSKLKVQASIMDDKVRVTGKKIDDLQAVITLLKSAELETPLQYVNMKS